jgi:hypothetical protein
MSNESLADYLNAMNASPDVVQQALRYYLSQRTDDLPPEDMQEQLLAHHGYVRHVLASYPREGSRNPADTQGLRWLFHRGDRDSLR